MAKTARFDDIFETCPWNASSLSCTAPGFTSVNTMNGAECLKLKVCALGCPEVPWRFALVPRCLDAAARRERGWWDGGAECLKLWAQGVGAGVGCAPGGALGWLDAWMP